MIGFYHVQKGRATADRTEKDDHFERAIDAYCKAAEVLPEDDEEYTCKYRSSGGASIDDVNSLLCLCH
jgi:hypothetical protein